MIDREVGITFDRRSSFFLLCGAILTLILILRMLQMQVFQHEYYKKLSERNSYRVRIDLPIRGKIMDMHGVPLAKDVPIYRIYIIPDETDNLVGLLASVQKELGLRPVDMERIDRRIKKQRGFQAVMIKESTDWNKLASLQLAGLAGLHIEKGFSRRYPSKAAGAQIIGYTGISTGELKDYQQDSAVSPFWTTGLAGLEKTFDETLTGVAGKTVMVVDAIGRTTGEDSSMKVSGKDGQDVYTTIDERIQRKLYELLEPHKSGSGVVMEISTGNIIAMVSAPSFDANEMRGDDSANMVQSLRNDLLKPFMNKAIEGLYPPGSTFKIVVALAALESGKINPTTKINCPGHWEYGKHLYHCWEKHGHGNVDMIKALAESCDTYFYQVALKIGIDEIRDMAKKLGLGEKQLELLPREMAGIIPDKDWKNKNIGIRWQHGDTIITGIGQGFVLANSLQIATMMARVSTNSMIMPKLIASAYDESPATLGLSQQNINTVLGGLEKVTEEGGTAYGAAINVGGQKMGGKTGTSQVRSISKQERISGVRTNEQLPWNLRNHGLFVGYAPTSNPKYVVTIITEHSGGSGPAARVASGVMKELLNTK